ncbi:MAG: histidine phosphatase family protein [Streptosporangiales bacterium]|nr:histidine phosphatase family protein [Streptosporangiales bacterium]
MLHFVRHGESTWNVEGRVQGQTPHVPLTAAGREQAHSAAGELAGRDARLLVTSDLTRALQTAEIVGRTLRLTPMLEPRLREQSLGSLEGRLAAELVPETTSPGRHVSSVRWGGGESVVDVHARVGAYLRELLSDRGEGDIVLVSHGDTIRIALAYLRGHGPRDVDWSALPNGSVTTVGVG